MSSLSNHIARLKNELRHKRKDIANIALNSNKYKTLNVFTIIFLLA